jgi:DNA polymerase-3 subunit beta
VKFRCEREALAEALAATGRAAAGRVATHPLLSGLLMEVADDRLTITGSDGDLTIQVSVEVGADSNGRAVVPARLTSDIVRSLASGKVEIALEADKLHITNARSSFKVSTKAADDYPSQASLMNSSVTLSSAELGEALRQVVRAVKAEDSHRPSLTGVLMSAEADGLRMVATDTYRLTMRELRGRQVLDAGQKVIIPGKALQELQRLLNSGDSVTMRLGDQHARFEVGTTSLSTRLIGGDYPPVLHLIQPTYQNVVTVEREPLLEAIRRAKIMAKDSHIKLTMKADTITLEAITNEEGEAKEDIDAQFEGNEFFTAFNPDYLSAGVEACQGDSITISMNENNRPAVLRGVGHEDYLYLLMPHRIPG